MLCACGSSEGVVNIGETGPPERQTGLRLSRCLGTRRRGRSEAERSEAEVEAPETSRQTTAKIRGTFGSLEFNELNGIH